MVDNKGDTFEVALPVLRTGGKVTRMGWHGKGQYLQMQTPDANSANTLPYIYIVIPPQNTPVGEVPAAPQRVPWVASQTDLLAGDWFQIIE